MQWPLTPRAAVPLTYDAVLNLFNEALADPDWRQNDAALPFKMPSNKDSSDDGDDYRKREAPECEDPMSLPPHKRRRRIPTRRGTQNPKAAGGV